MRRHHICVTGTIGSGKSHISRLFTHFGYLLFDADDVVHQLMTRKDIIAEIKKICPHAIVEKKIDRVILGQAVFKEKEKLKKLEELLHPRVAASREAFTRHAQANRRYCVFEVPLYFEAGLHYDNIKIVVTTAPQFLLQERALKRPGMTEEKFGQVLSFQMPDSLKIKKADFVVHTGLSKGYSWVQVSNIVKTLDKN